MRLDRANRTFLIVMTLSSAIGALLLCGAVGGVLVPLLLARAAQGHLSEIFRADLSLIPVALFGVLTATALARGLRSLLLRIRASRRLACRVRDLMIETPAALATAVHQAGLEGRVVLVDAPEPFSFVYGVLTPRIALSLGLLQRASRKELGAVLEHEHYHVRNLDPLKVVLTSTFSAALYFLPVVEGLCARYAAERELAADRRAVAACGRRSLAGALLGVVRGPDWSELSAGTAIGGDELLDARVGQLENGAEPAPERLRAKTVALSLFGAAVLAATFVASVSTFGGQSAVHGVAGAGLANATLLRGLFCAAPFMLVGICAYGLVAVRARRPLMLPSLPEPGATARRPVGNFR